MSNSAAFPVVIGLGRLQLTIVLDAFRLYKQRANVVALYEQQCQRSTYLGVDLYCKPNGQWALVLAEARFGNAADVQNILRGQKVQGVRVLSFEHFVKDQSWG